jgi:hypothetical protein
VAAGRAVHVYAGCSVADRYAIRLSARAGAVEIRTGTRRYTGTVPSGKFFGLLKSTRSC